MLIKVTPAYGRYDLSSSERSRDVKYCPIMAYTMNSETNASDTLPSTTLADLRPGQRGEIIETGGTGLIRRRLQDLGLLPGAAVEVVMTSPMGDPIALRVRNTTLAIRRDDARHIRVRRS